MNGLESDELDYIASNLRHEDEEELKAWGLDPSFLVSNENAFCQHGLQWCVWREGKPVFALGLQPQLHRTYSVWGFGTPEANQIMGELGRWMKREWFDEVFGFHRARRIEAKVPLSSDKSWHWLMWLGAKLETRMPRFGAEGQDFLLLSFTDKDYEDSKHVFLPPARTNRPGSSRSPERENVC